MEDQRSGKTSFIVRDKNTLSETSALTDPHSCGPEMMLLTYDHVIFTNVAENRCVGDINQDGADHIGLEEAFLSPEDMWL